MLRRPTAILLLVAGAALGALFWQRWSLPYNEQGRYFDAAQGVVYEAQAAEVYGMLSGILMLAGVMVLVIGRRSADEVPKDKVGPVE